MPPFNVFRPPTSVGTTFGYVVVLVCGIVGGGLLYKGLTIDVGPKQIGPLVAGPAFIAMSLLFLYWTWSLSALTYLIDRNALSIRWGSLRQIIPLTNIERLVAHVDEDGAERGRHQLDGAPRGQGGRAEPGQRAVLLGAPDAQRDPLRADAAARPTASQCPTTSSSPRRCRRSRHADRR